MASGEDLSESEVSAILQRGGDEFLSVVLPAADTTAFWLLGNTMFHFVSLIIWHSSSFLMLVTFQQICLLLFEISATVIFVFLKI